MSGNAATGFRASPWPLRKLRRWRRHARYRVMMWLFDRGILDGAKLVGSYRRERRGVMECVRVTRRDKERGRFYVVPPGEWEQNDADWAIRRGRELAAERGWADVKP